jgi:hypothetical protein
MNWSEHYTHTATVSGRSPLPKPLTNCLDNDIGNEDIKMMKTLSLK